MKKIRILLFLFVVLSVFSSANIFAVTGTSTNIPTSTANNTTAGATNTDVKPVTSSKTDATNTATSTDTNIATARTNMKASFSPSQVKGIQKIVHDYLVNNPQVLVEVSEALQKKQARLAQKNAMSAIVQYKKQLFEDPKTPTAGNPNGTVYLVEFFDYQCGHCKTMGSVISSILKTNKNVKMIFKELPIFGGASRYAARMALASAAQGKYYSFHNALFQASGPLNESLVKKIAKSVGLNFSKLQQAAAAPWLNTQLRANFRLAQNLKLVGTPAFVIANKALTKFRFIPGATSQGELNKQIAAVTSDSSGV